MIADLNRYISVQLDPAAHDWLERVRTGAPRRASGSWVLIDVWLTRDHPAGPFIAHIGGQRVGIVDPDGTTEFDHVLRALLRCSTKTRSSKDGCAAQTEPDRPSWRSRRRNAISPPNSGQLGVRYPPSQYLEAGSAFTTRDRHTLRNADRSAIGDRWVVRDAAS